MLLVILNDCFCLLWGTVTTEHCVFSQILFVVMETAFLLSFLLHKGCRKCYLKCSPAKERGKDEFKQYLTISVIGHEDGWNTKYKHWWLAHLIIPNECIEWERDYCVSMQILLKVECAIKFYRVQNGFELITLEVFWFDGIMRDEAWSSPQWAGLNCLLFYRKSFLTIWIFI